MYEKLPKSPADKELFEKFKTPGLMQAYEYFDGDKSFREIQKQSFFSYKIHNPTLDNRIDIDKIHTDENDLLELKEFISENENNEVIKQIYNWRINEKIAENRMLLASESGDMNRFKRYSEYIYGKPSKEIFDYTIRKITEKAIEFVDSEDEDIKFAATDLLNCLPFISEQKFVEIPSDELVSIVCNETVNSLGGLIDITSDKNLLTTNEVKPIFENALQQIGAIENWKIVIDEKCASAAVNVNYENEQVRIPAGLEFTQRKIGSLVLHEIGTHVARRINGEQSNLKLLGLGLDRYEAGDEGVATMREQAYEGKFDDYKGLDGTLAIGLCYGLDDIKRDFRGVYDILKKYYYFNNVSGGNLSSVESLEKAQNSAWNRAVRTFRGTDCKTPGVCFTKDIVYLDGNIGVWNVIKNNSNEMHRFNVGKYNPANPRHIWALNQLGITDQD